MNKTIEDLVVQLSHDSFNPELNFKCAVEYQKLNQTASAVSFYLRAAEFGVDTHKDIVYASLLKIAECFKEQKDRQWNVTNYLLHAVTYLPERPEAYLLISQYYERESQWQESYTWAHLGIYANHNLKPLPTQVGYDGYYCLEFQKAVAGWWIGRKNESKMLLEKLEKYESMAAIYRNAVKSNLERIK
ncbi:MAG: hypothetical protein ACO3UU_09830 [Minisyncoccia bacterium]